MCGGSAWQMIEKHECHTLCTRNETPEFVKMLTYVSKGCLSTSIVHVCLHTHTLHWELWSYSQNLSNNHMSSCSQNHQRAINPHHYLTFCHFYGSVISSNLALSDWTLIRSFLTLAPFISNYPFTCRHTTGGGFCTTTYSRCRCLNYGPGSSEVVGCVQLAMWALLTKAGCRHEHDTRSQNPKEKQKLSPVLKLQQIL